MTLIQMTNVISAEMGVYDATSLGLIKVFLDKEYNILWDKYPWKDTQMAVSVVLSAGDATIPMPPGMDRVTMMRAGNIASGVAGTPERRSDFRLVEPITEKFLLDTDPGIFEVGGYVQYYSELSTFPNPPTLQFHPTPTRDTSLAIVGKAICPGLIVDTSTSAIRNLDPALIAYATADFLQRQRQYGKADIKYKRGQELEQVAWSLEQEQANQPRLTKATTVAGNSLSEMTDAVCTICGQWTPDYRLIIREFLRRNYQTLYDIFLWPESLVMVRVPYTTEQVVMPHYVDKVLGIRGTTNLRMFPADAGLFLDISPSMFDEIGDPIGYTTLTPVGVSVLPEVTAQLVLASTSVVDTGPVTIRGEVLASGQEIAEEVKLNGTTPVTTVFAYDVPITIAKDITIGDVTVNSNTTDFRSLVVIPANQRELKHQRLWFLPSPDASTLSDGTTFTCLVLGKRAIRPLLTDQDTPIITGAQQVLIAAAAADLFRKLEKHDMANAFQQKASGSTDVLKAKNTDQAASAPRFVPQCEAHAYVAEYGW